MDWVPFVSMSAGSVYRTSEVATYIFHDDLFELVSGWVSPSQFGEFQNVRANLR